MAQHGADDEGREHPEEVRRRDGPTTHFAPEGDEDGCNWEQRKNEPVIVLELVGVEQDGLVGDSVWG